MTFPATVFVYQHKRTLKSKCVHFSDGWAAGKGWSLVCTLNAAEWIELVLNADQQQRERLVERLKL